MSSAGMSPRPLRPYYGTVRTAMAKKRKTSPAKRNQAAASRTPRISPDEIKKRYRLKKILQNVFLLIVFAAAFFAFWIINNPEAIGNPGLVRVLKISTAVVSLTALLLFYLNWTCPACKKNLGRLRNPQKCPHCGAIFR